MIASHSAHPAEAGVVIVGGGNMGLALAAGFAATGALAVTVVDPSPERARAKLPAGVAVTLIDSPAGIAGQPGMIVLAVKPALVPRVLAGYRSLIDAGALVVSIAAGVGHDAIRSRLGPQARVIRAMPNTPALVRQGMTVLHGGPGLAEADRQSAERLFQAVGATAWVDREELIDAATAVSGSGPAYVFAFAEHLAAAGAAAGLPAALAAELARATLVGAVALMNQPGAEARALKRMVCSPGGTTEAGLSVLEGQPGLAELLEGTVRAARERAAALSRG
ncbi:pyrroline-5-carboxylate reductase [Phreatobacter stygius]|uniref:Pyrroline-5-carboxylate reductase n=1 Tax=Phreatobacter stygius TaxID=1940610 RepID=A0A4D7AXA4_9HYPH|nr:pyrroline-5-carboxylate reductase [Phreatobacter stygius]QCI64115.1 pyrroline-5-carboxylate reductase [Phreatobacter stygius]